MVEKSGVVTCPGSGHVLHSHQRRQRHAGHVRPQTVGEAGSCRSNCGRWTRRAASAAATVRSSIFYSLSLSLSLSFFLSLLLLLAFMRFFLPFGLELALATSSFFLFKGNPRDLLELLSIFSLLTQFLLDTWGTIFMFCKLTSVLRSC